MIPKKWTPAKIAAAALAVCLVAAAFVVFKKRSGTVFEFAGVVGDFPAGTNAVLVRNGEIEDIGRVEDLKGEGRLDRSFVGLYAARGFHDSSVRLSASCVALSADFIIAPERWPRMGGGFWPAAEDRGEFERALKSAGDVWKSRDVDDFALVFGYAPGVHGPLSRAELDATFSDRPCVVASRCFGTFVANTASLKKLGLLEGRAIDRLSRMEGTDIPGGKFSGSSAMTFARIAFSGEKGRKRLERGSKLLADHLSSVGITSVRDSTSSFSSKKWAESAFSGFPIDVRISLDPMPSVAREGFERAGERLTAELSDDGEDGGNVGWNETPSAHLKIDGAAIAGARQSKRSDGGAWTWPQEHLDSMCKTFLSRGYGVRYETNGSFGLDMALSHLHRRTFEMTKPPGASAVEILAVEADGADSAEKAAAVEARVSFDPHFSGSDSKVFHHFEKAGVETGLHSDMPAGGIGAANPLESAKAARSLGASAKKSIACLAPPKSDGKMANFAILDADPTMGDANVVGILFRGKPRSIGKRFASGGNYPIDIEKPFGDRGGFDPGYVGDSIVEAAYGVKRA